MSDISRLYKENRKLKKALNTLLEEMDGNNYAVDTDRVRSELGEEVTPIKPPWERDNYESKQEWLEDKKND